MCCDNFFLLFYYFIILLFYYFIFSINDLIFLFASFAASFASFVFFSLPDRIFASFSLYFFVFSARIAALSSSVNILGSAVFVDTPTATVDSGGGGGGAAAIGAAFVGTPTAVDFLFGGGGGATVLREDGALNSATASREDGATASREDGACHCSS